MTETSFFPAKKDSWYVGKPGCPGCSRGGTCGIQQLAVRVRDVDLVHEDVEVRRERVDVEAEVVERLSDDQRVRGAQRVVSGPGGQDLDGAAPVSPFSMIPSTGDDRVVDEVRRLTFGVREAVRQQSRHRGVEASLRAGGGVGLVGRARASASVKRRSVIARVEPRPVIGGLIGIGLLLVVPSPTFPSGTVAYSGKATFWSTRLATYSLLIMKASASRKPWFDMGSSRRLKAR